MTPVLVLACSPRPGGNSDALADCFAEGVRSGGQPAEVLRLRDFRVRPCTRCGRCATSPGRQCMLAAGDDAEALFSRMLAAPLVCIAAPVYFYGPPAGLKAFIDRAQRFWRADGAGGTARQEGGALWAGLVAGRPRGEKLFLGTELSLKYWCLALGLELAECHHCLNCDGPDALRQDRARCEVIRAWGRRAAAAAARRAE